MEGILDMSQLLMELIAERLKQPPIPLILLHLLATVNLSCFCVEELFIMWVCVHDRMRLSRWS